MPDKKTQGSKLRKKKTIAPGRLKTTVPQCYMMKPGLGNVVLWVVREGVECCGYHLWCCCVRCAENGREPQAGESAAAGGQPRGQGAEAALRTGAGECMQVVPPPPHHPQVAEEFPPSSHSSTSVSRAAKVSDSNSQWGTTDGNITPPPLPLFPPLWEPRTKRLPRSKPGIGWI